MSDIHVTKNSENTWLIQEGGVGDPLGAFNTQDEAVSKARRLAEERSAELVIHGTDGQIREKDSHGNDPTNIPG